MLWGLRAKWSAWRSALRSRATRERGLKRTDGTTSVRVMVADARTVELRGKFDGLLMFAAAGIYASSPVLANLFPYLKDDARVAAFGAKLSHRRSGKVLNPLLRLLWKLSFSSTPAVNYELWAPLKDRIGEFHVQEYFFRGMFLAWGSLNA